MRKDSHSLPPTSSSPDIEALDDELGKAYRRSRNADIELGFDPVEADRRARGLDIDDFEGYRSDMQKRPPEQLRWPDIVYLRERDPAAADEEWQRIQEVAKQELQSGQRTASALTGGGSPMEQARFIALHDAFAEEWKPGNAVEAALVAVLAESYSDYFSWCEEKANLRRLGVGEEKSREENGERVTLSLSVARATDRAMKHADQAHKRFITTLRTLKDLQCVPSSYNRSPPRMTIYGGQHVHTDRNTGVIEANDDAALDE